MKYLWFISGAFCGLATLSVAMGSVPTHVTDDTAIYQRLSEIRVPHHAKINFDHEIAELSAQEPRFQEALPSLANHPRLREPLRRISKRKYRYSGSRSRFVRSKLAND